MILEYYILFLIQWTNLQECCWFEFSNFYSTHHNLLIYIYILITRLALSHDLATSNVVAQNKVIPCIMSCTWIALLPLLVFIVYRSAMIFSFFFSSFNIYLFIFLSPYQAKFRDCQDSNRIQIISLYSISCVSLYHSLFYINVNYKIKIVRELRSDLDKSNFVVF